jgi:hypothetical protein
MVSIKAMNMNKVLLILTAASGLLLFSYAVAVSHETVFTPQMPPKQMARLNESIERAIVCHLYWQEGKTVTQIRKMITDRRPMRYELRRGEGDDLSVFVEDYQWEIDLTPIGGDYFGFYVDDFRKDARGDINESNRNFTEALNRQFRITNGVLILQPEVLRVLAFDKPKGQRFKTITNIVATNLLNSRWLKIAIASNQVHGSIVIHIGGFNNESPWIYYRIEGMPYIGMMLIDPSSGEFIHDDFLYIHEDNQESERENVIHAVDANAATFILTLPSKS